MASSKKEVIPFQTFHLQTECEGFLLWKMRIFMNTFDIKKNMMAYADSLAVDSQFPLF